MEARSLQQTQYLFFPKQHQEFFLNQTQASKKLGLGVDAGDLQEAYDKGDLLEFLVEKVCL